MGGLKDLLYQHRSEYYQHDQVKTLNFYEMLYDTPLTHTWGVYGLASWCCTRMCSHHLWPLWKLIRRNNSLIQAWYLRLWFISIYLLIYSLLYIISADRNCLFQPTPIGLPYFTSLHILNIYPALLWCWYHICNLRALGTSGVHILIIDWYLYYCW